MPSPFMRLGTPVQSKTQVERPKPITPIMERVQGDNHPYRGTELHGVDDTANPHDPETYGFDADDPNADNGAHFQPIQDDAKDPDPIPVTIIRGDGWKKELRTFGTDRIIVDNTVANNPANRPVEIIGRSESRFNITLSNLDATNTVLIGATREEVATRGYPLGPGKEKSITTENPIFAMAVGPYANGAYPVPNGTVMLAYIAEYTIKEA